MSVLERKMNEAEHVTKSHEDRLNVQEDNAVNVLTDGKQLLKQVTNNEQPQTQTTSINQQSTNNKQQTESNN